MDINAVNATTKVVAVVSKPPPAAATPSASGTSGSIVNSPAQGGDAVTLSAAGRLSLRQANSKAGSDAPVGNEQRPASSGLVQENLQRKFSVTDNRQVVVQLIDPKTKDVVKQTPTKEEVKLREAVRNLVDGQAPQKPRANNNDVTAPGGTGQQGR